MNQRILMIAKPKRGQSTSPWLSQKGKSRFRKRSRDLEAKAHHQPPKSKPILRKAHPDFYRVNKWNLATVADIKNRENLHKSHDRIKTLTMMTFTPREALLSHIVSKFNRRSMSSTVSTRSLPLLKKTNLTILSLVVTLMRKLKWLWRTSTRK